MSRTILVVEDEPRIMRMIQVNLQRAGYEIIMASNAEQALVEAERIPPELIIIDQTLPDMAGNELAKTLRQRYPQNLFQLILMFPWNIDPAWMEGWRGPSDRFLTKPFNPMELIGYVKRYFGEL